MHILHCAIRWGVILPLFLLGACSAINLAYKNSDYLLLRYADSYLDLSSEQKKYLRSRLKDRLMEHRGQELPNAVAWLELLKRRAADGLNPQEIDELTMRVEPIIKTTLAKTIPVLTPVLADLSDKQIAHLQTEMAEKNGEIREEYLQEDRAKRFKAKTKRITERIERWIGGISEDQQRLVVSITALWPDIADDWYDYRLQQQQKLLDMIEKRAATEKIEVFLLAWWGEQSGQPRDVNIKLGQLREGIKTLLLALDGSMSQEQRTHLVTRIDDIGSELAALTSPPTQLNHSM